MAVCFPNLHYTAKYFKVCRVLHAIPVSITFFSVSSCNLCFPTSCTNGNFVATRVIDACSCPRDYLFILF